MGGWESNKNYLVLTLIMNQKQVWNNIAEEWFKFKTEPAEHVFDFLKTRTGKVLDFGSGAGRHLKKIKKGKMYLVDFSKKMIELAKKRAKEKKINAEFCISDIKKLPFEDNSFDSAIAIAVFHCIKGEKNQSATIVSQTAPPLAIFFLREIRAWRRRRWKRA